MIPWQAEDHHDSELWNNHIAGGLQLDWSTYLSLCKQHCVGNCIVELYSYYGWIGKQLRNVQHMLHHGHS